MMTPEEREVALVRMEEASGEFYRHAQRAGVHPFLEFTGVMNEYIKLCREAHKQGIDFTDCNTHTGQDLPMKGYMVNYLNEKLECIFTGRVKFKPAQVKEEAAVAQDALGADLERRTWHYVNPPKAFEMAPCACGNAETQWSEFEGHCWCERCQIDFKPSHAGIFDGPVPIRLATLLGMRFDRVILATGQIDPFDIEEGRFQSDPPQTRVASA